MMTDDLLIFRICTLDYRARCFEEYAEEYRRLCTVDEYEELAMMARQKASLWRAELNSWRQMECA